MGMALANNSWQSISVPAPGGGAYCYSWADLSPDGTLIVFQRQQTAQAKPDLWLMDAARTEARQLTNTASLSESDPRWSPDGTRIAFFRHGSSSSEKTIVVYSLATGLATEMGTFSDLTGNPNALEWLDDSRLLFFAHARQGNSYGGDKWRYFTGWPGLGTGRTTSASVTCPYSSGAQKCTFITRSGCSI
jgi:Tol biopolymer transport system component